MIAKEVVKKEFVRTDKAETVPGLIGKLKSAKQTVAFVFEKENFLGIVTLKSLIKTRIETQEKFYRKIWHVPSVQEDEDIVDIATLMFHSNSSALPVVKDKKVVGAVFSNDIIRHIKNMPELKGLKVRDIRHPPVKKIKGGDRIGKAFEMMIEEDINRIPVVDDNNKLVGIVSFGDIMNKFLSSPIKRMGGFKPSANFPSTRGYKAEREDMMALPVKSFESIKDMVTAKLDDSIIKVADLMVNNDISGIVITSNNEADSIVTKRDLLEAMMNTKKVVVENIQFIGLSDLKDASPQVKEYIKKMSSFYGEKISYLIKNINNIKVHIKEHDKGGKAHKYSVHIQVIAPTATINSTKAVGWDISKVMHEAFKDVERQILRRFKTDTSYKKRYY